ncbi:MAG TPA: SGNH/GDSL hydrolase family protein [Verrucomicrobiales bacterium]|jgi:hypothetical protein|nr:SGNH/GDSL hydrolase family protein [Verrucomicrobiales bacterium]
MSFRLLRFLSLAAVCSAQGQETYPPLKSPGDTATRGAALQRTMSLLSTSAVEKKNTVRILFYGQSITEQSWWKLVYRDLEKRFPLAVLEVENRAIGGHSSDRLVKTAEADLYPFYPDLVIFHVYGDHNRYGDIIRRIRERTTAEVLIQTDHLGAKDPLVEETDPAKLAPAQWNAWMNYSFLPATAKKYDCELLPQRDLWKQYLKENRLEPRALLKDDVHLNDHGCFVMAEIVKTALVAKDSPPDAPWRKMVQEIPLTEASWKDGKLTFPFEGNRVDGVFRGATGNTAAGLASMKIDGKAPGDVRQLYTFTRSSGYNGTAWPCLLRVQRGPAQLQEEEWTVTLANASDDYKSFLFSLTGSKTGPDGVGSAGKKFVSKSGRIVIEPEDWNLQSCRKVFNRKLEDGARITWKSAPQWNALPLARGTILGRGTFLHGLSNGKHTLELSGESLKNSGLSALRIYHPPVPQTEDPAADASKP